MDKNDRNALKKQYGEMVKRMRLKHGLTQADLAEWCNVSDVYISLTEQGKRLPSISAQRSLAHQIGTGIICPSCGNHISNSIEEALSDV